jgi:hypothetical protein
MTYLGKFGLLLILVSPFGMANTLLDKLADCSKNNDDLQRLTCYDEVVAKAKNSQTKQHIEQHQAPLQVATTKQVNHTNQQQSEFGQEDKQRAKNLIKQIQATIISIKKAPHGELIITLDNGQVWRQTDSIRIKLRKDHLVNIERGAMGSFFIGTENANKRIRAKRVK